MHMNPTVIQSYDMVIVFFAPQNHHRALIVYSIDKIGKIDKATSDFKTRPPCLI